MKSNPTQIEPGTVFICGNMDDPDSEKEFSTLAEYLNSVGYKFINPYEIPIQEAKVDNRQSQIISFLAMCDLVVTLTGWEKSNNAMNQVSVARIMKKNIIISEMFDRYNDLQKSN